GIAYRQLSRPAGTDPAATSMEITSLAVLPFVNDKQNPVTEYMNEGLADSLINCLSELPRLPVIARAPALRYKNRDVPPQEAGRELNVQAVLTGQIAQRAGEFQVNAELMAVADNRHLWGGTFRRPQADAVRVQEEVARQVVDRLRPRLT